MQIGNYVLFIQKERMSILAKIMAPSCRDRDNKTLIYGFFSGYRPSRGIRKSRAGVAKILSFVYFPTGALCEMGGGAVCETWILSNHACAFVSITSLTLNSTIPLAGRKGHF